MYNRTVIIFAVLICGVLARIPYSAVNLEVLLKTGNQDFETNIRQSLQTSKNFWTQNANIIKGITYVGQLVPLPFVGALFGALQLMQDIFASESDWKESFVKSISTQTEQVSATQSIQQIEAALETVAENLGYLGNVNFTSVDKVAIAHIIHSRLGEIVNQFARPGSFFKRQPAISVTPLLALSSFVIASQPIIDNLVPGYSGTSTLSCRLHEILEDYRSATLFFRLNQVIAANRPRKNTDGFFGFLVYVFNRTPYDVTPYLVTALTMPHQENNDAEGFLDCEKPIDLKYDELTDQSNNATYFDKQSAAPTRPCIESYMQLIKKRVDRLFPIVTMGKICSSDIKSRIHRKKTGNGTATSHQIDSATFSRMRFQFN